MASTLFDRIDTLAANLGEGRLEIHQVVDQVYAHVQHESLEFDHPRGGNAEYMRRPLLTEQARYMQKLADGLLADDGLGLARAAIEVSEDFVVDTAEQTPREFEDLMRSGHPFVIDDGVTVYDRAPEVGRLSEAELREKDRARDGLGLHVGHRQHIPEDVKGRLRELREKRRQGLR